MFPAGRPGIGAVGREVLQSPAAAEETGRIQSAMNTSRTGTGFRRLRIRNYRAFGDLEIERLGRINLFTGRNGSGKTTLLEALFLLCGAGNPRMAADSGVIREFDPATSATAVPETVWKPMFTGLDAEKTARITGLHDLGPMELSISIDSSGTARIPPGDSRRMSAATAEPSNPTGLLLSFRMGSGKTVESRMHVTAGGLQAEAPDVRPPFGAVFLSSRGGNPREVAARLGRRRRRKRGDPVVEALRLVEPGLRNLEDGSAGGLPMIPGDIGLPEPVPLPAMGEGMTRIARAVLAISAAPNGIVLVDGIENGLHHSTLPRAWKAMDTAARRFDTQIVATTHSFECLKAAHDVLDASSLLVHRLETAGEEARCVTYGSGDLKAAVSHNLEVR